MMQFSRSWLFSRACTAGTTKALLLSGIFLLAGCAILGGANNSETEVRSLAQSRWDALVAGDWEKAYSFASPAYRKTVDLFNFRLRTTGTVKRTSATVTGVVCQETTCDVSVRIEFVLPQTKLQTSTDMTERWFEDGGKWWSYEKL